MPKLPSQIFTMLESRRQNSLPVLHVRGSYYDVGYNVGRTFSGLIKSLIEIHPALNNEYLPVYETDEGKEVYDHTYQCVTKYFPHYMRELKGMADGSGIPFYKLFLLHMDDILPVSVNQKRNINSCQGCSSVCLNESKHEIIGHTEDAFEEVLNHVYILDAEITETQPTERFTAFCYAGLLPGYAMGFNKYGLVYSINIIAAKHLSQGKLPRTFVTRALLTADSLESALTILRCEGVGIGDAMSVNLGFLNQTGHRTLYNIEVSPSYPASNESLVSVQTVQPGESLFHANKFLRLQVPECPGPLYESSIARHETREGHLIFDTKCVVNLLGDTTHTKYNIFRSSGAVWTVAVGIFDCLKRTWSIYMDNPKTSKPILVFPMDY